MKRIIDKYSKRLGFYTETNIEPLVYYLNKNKAKTKASCGHEGEVMFKSKKSFDNAKDAVRKLKLTKSSPVKFEASRGKTRNWYEMHIKPSDLPKITNKITKVTK